MAPEASFQKPFPSSSLPHAAGGFVLILVGGSLWILAGCAAPTPAGQIDCPSSDSSAQVAPDRIPLDFWQSGLDLSIEGELDEALQLRLEATTAEFLERVPGVGIAVAIPGQGLWSTQTGLANALTEEPVSNDHLFQIASITKSYVAVAALQLVEEGRLALGDRVSAWFPDIPHADLMTVAQLLRHTNGLRSYNALPEFGTRYLTPEETIGMAAARPLMFCPGTNWSYTNTGYAMLGRILESIEGKPLGEILEARITSPLGLRSTALRTFGDGLTSVVSGHASRAPVEVEDDYATAYAAGAIASTAPDVLRFWHGLLSGKFLPPARLTAIFSETHAMDAGGQAFYGMGVQVYDVAQGPGLMLGHSGGITGFTSVVAYIPEDDAYVAVLFNDKNVPAEAGLWSIVQALRNFREEERPRGP